MKKSIALFLILILLISFTACGKSQAVKDVEAAITNIGEVNLDSDKAITDAEKQYEALSEKEAKAVENYSDLTAARETYNSLVYKEAIDNMEKFDYEKAISLLESIPSYKDVGEKLEEAKQGVFQKKCATYIINFVKSGFYNPSAARVLEASYGDKTDKYASAFEADGILYFSLQGTNKMGGTIVCEYCILFGGANDGKYYENDTNNNYNESAEVVDVPTINKIIQKYWEDYGIN